MTRYLILSDIHANWEALQAVLRHAEGSYDEIVCLGDFVGYGPDPNLVVEWAREHVAFAVRGNHDRTCTDYIGLEDFSPLARTAAVWTHGVLSAENANYLRALPQGPVAVGDFEIVHGSPNDEDEYLVETYEAADAFQLINQQVTFFGHTHLQGGFSVRRGKVTPLNAYDQELFLEEDAAYLLNPGSVGQPRDLDPQAAYSLYTPGAGHVSYRRVPYAVVRAQRKIREAGLPALLADRLAIGK